MKAASTTVAVEHVTLTSSQPFAQVRKRLEETLPHLDGRIVEQLTDGDKASVKAYDDAGPHLSIFLERDHGSLLEIAGRKRKAIQYEIGNPLTASKMTRHNLGAALYAPLRVVLYENDDGAAVFEYDRPSSLFGQFGDKQVSEVARSLDADLEAALRVAGG